MRIIDEKGKLFGKVNIIDFLVILLLFCILPVFFLGYQILSKKDEAPKKELVEIELDFRLVKLKPELLKIISVGDKEFDENGQKIGEIIALGEIEEHKYEFAIGSKQKIIREDPILKQLKAKMKLNLEIKGNELYYKGNIVKVGSPLKFKTNNYKVTGIFLGKLEKIEGEEKEIDLYVDLYVILKDLDKDTLKKISVGDKELDEKGETIAEIINLGKTDVSTLEINLGEGSFATGERSNKKQIFAKMRLKTQKGKESQLYFKGKMIKHKMPFEFSTDKYNISTVVTKTFEEVPAIKEKWLSLQVKFSGVSPEIANVIQKGNIEKDIFGNVTATINSIISNKPSQVLTLKGTEFITLNHPYNRDIYLSLNVLCVGKEGLYYFKNFPVKMGNNVTFATDLYSISGLVVGIKIK